jgi:hypothetical protein
MYVHTHIVRIVLGLAQTGLPLPYLCYVTTDRKLDYLLLEASSQELCELCEEEDANHLLYHDQFAFS